MFIILSKTKLWNFFTDPNPSTRNLYLNIGFVSIPDDTLRMVSNSPKSSDQEDRSNMAFVFGKC